MALTTFEHVIDRAQETHPALSDAKGLAYAEEVYRELVAWTEIGREQVSLSVTDGTRDYDLPTGVVNIIKAVYRTGADEYSELSPRSEEAIEGLRRSFRVGNEEGDPRYFALFHPQVSGAVKPRIRLEPIPDTTTSTYPVIELEVNSIPSSFSSSTVIPSHVPNPDVFVDGILAKYTKIYLPDEHIVMKARYRESLDDTISFLKNVSKEEPGMIVPSYLLKMPNQS